MLRHQSLAETEFLRSVVEKERAAKNKLCLEYERQVGIYLLCTPMSMSDEKVVRVENQFIL